MGSYSQSTCCGICQQNDWRGGENIEWYSSFEQGSVIHPSNNGSSFWTIFTLTWSSIGVVLSAAALLLLVLTALLFAEWRQSYKNQLLIQFMLARFLYTCIRYFSDIQNILRLCPSSDFLVFLDVLGMVYSEMVLVAWMFVFSRQMYINLVKVFATENPNIWKVSLWTWFGCAIISVLLNVIMYVSNDTYGSYFILYLILMKWPTLIANAVLLILVLRSILLNNKRSKNNMRIILVMILLIFAFCVQQLLLDACKIYYFEKKDKLNMNIITSVLIFSNIFAMYHCSFATVFWVLGNANTRKLWKFQHLRGKIRMSI